jgi:hypothetical protein
MANNAPIVPSAAPGGGAASQPVIAHTPPVIAPPKPPVPPKPPAPPRTPPVPTVRPPAGLATGAPVTPPKPAPPAPPAAPAAPVKLEAPAPTQAPVAATGFQLPASLASLRGGLEHTLAAAATETNPPLTRLTHHLGEFQPAADSALRAIQGQVRDPARFGLYASTLGAPVTRTALAAPGGLPLLLGLHGLLSGGQAFADVRELFKPLLNRVG